MVSYRADELPISHIFPEISSEVISTSFPILASSVECISGDLDCPLKQDNGKSKRLKGYSSSSAFVVTPTPPNTELSRPALQI